MLLLTAKSFAVTNFVYLLAAVTSPVSSDDGYGTEYLNFLDETGVTREMNFSVLPADSGWKHGTVYFYLFTRNNELDPERIHVPKNGSDLKCKYFNESNDIKVVTHGWLSSGNTSWILDIKDSYLQRYDTNVVTVDWSLLADNLVYPWSAAATRYVGKRVSKLLESFVKSYDVRSEQMHLIGHSLGAQVMGFAGMFFDGVINRITGLDPARPLFELPPMLNECRLSSEDARFVDIIHTCGGVYGYLRSHGRADYYPNGGKPPEPGCDGLEQALALGSCSHGRAYEYFQESIQGVTPFVSYPCDSYEEFEKGNCRSNTSLMGNPAGEDSHGDYYLHTRNATPFAMGDEFNEKNED